MTMLQRMPAHLVVVASLVVVALSFAGSPHADAAVVAIAAAAIAAALGNKLVVAAMRTRIARVGARSRACERGLDRVPEPTHPDTAGRTRSRAPGRESMAV